MNLTCYWNRENVSSYVGGAQADTCKRLGYKHLRGPYCKLIFAFQCDLEAWGAFFDREVR